MFQIYLSHKFSLLFLKHAVESFTSQSSHVGSTFHSSHEGSNSLQRSHGANTQLCKKNKKAWRFQLRCYWKNSNQETDLNFKSLTNVRGKKQVGSYHTWFVYLPHSLTVHAGGEWSSWAQHCSCGSVLPGPEAGDLEEAPGRLTGPVCWRGTLLRWWPSPEPPPGGNHAWWGNVEKQQHVLLCLSLRHTHIGVVLL